MKLVIDTNIFMAAILRPSKVRRLILESPAELLFPEAILVEIEEHKEEILKKSGLSAKDFETVKSTLTKYVEIIPTSEVKPFFRKAIEIIGRIDKDDTPFIATCLAYDAILWSDDKKLKMQKEIKVLNSAEIIKLFSS